MTHAQLARLIAAIVRIRSAATDADALESVDIYPAWKPDAAYAVSDDRILYDGKLYRCVQAHTSQQGWEPPAVPALWTQVSVEEWPAWVQPTGAQDAYNLGAKVSHNGKHWISDYPSNVYEPGVFGWTEVV